MGRKLDALFGRRKYDTGKIKATLNLGLSRLSVLKNQRQARCNINNSDVLQLLNLGQHERALLRVDQVIKDQNMLDAYVIIEGYLHQLIERINLVWSAKECPEDVNEAAAGLIFASIRCGEFPELQEIRSLFASRFGKEFTARAMELRNNCGVSYKMIQKLSNKMPSLESRMKVLKAIASANNITLQLEEMESDRTADMMGSGSGSFQPVPRTPSHYEDVGNFEGSSDSVKRRIKYKDVAAAAQAAFESAAHAAAAAQAAVELARTDSRDPDGSNSLRKNRGDEDKEEQKAEKLHSVKKNDDDYEPKEEETVEQGKNDREFKRSFSSSSSESSDNVVYQVDLGSHNELMKKLEQKEVVIYDSDDEGSHHGISRTSLTRNQDFSEENELNRQGKKVRDSEKSYHMEEYVDEQIDRKHRHFPLSSHSGIKKEKAPEEKPASVRTKRT